MFARRSTYSTAYWQFNGNDKIRQICPSHVRSHYIVTLHTISSLIHSPIMICLVSSFVQWLDGVFGSLQSHWHLRFMTWILMSFARAPNTSQSFVCSMPSWNGLWLIWGYLSTCFGRDSAESDAWIALTSISDHSMIICSLFLFDLENCWLQLDASWFFIILSWVVLNYTLVAASVNNMTSIHCSKRSMCLTRPLPIMLMVPDGRCLRVIPRVLA